MHNLPGIIAAVFPSVSDAPIRLQGKAINHVFESPDEIVASIKNYYVNETLKQVYKIIGSLDFVGNPTILFSSFASGVRDLVFAPTAAFLKSPTNVRKIGIGVGKGTLSLFSHSASGIFGFSARLWATAGQTVAILSLDSEYRQWHRDRIVNEAVNLNRIWKRRGLQSIQEIMLRPVVDIILGVTTGATGFITAPYKGAKMGGRRGFLHGVAIGTIGLVAKPVVGVFDAFTHASQTIHDVAKSVNIMERRYQPAVKLRLPYVFGPMNILTPFDAVSSLSQYLLSIYPPMTKLKRRVHKGKEVHVHTEVLSMEPGVETYVIVTTIRAILIKLRRDNIKTLSPLFGWEVDLSSSAKVSSSLSDHGHNGVALTITKRAPKKAKKTKNNRQRELSKHENAKMCENTTISNAISGLNASCTASVESSALSCDDDVDDDELGETGGVDRKLPQSTPEDQVKLKSSQVDSLSEGNGATEYHYKETTEQGELLEWFTVLAEYQHREQLSRLHNAISCIVGDYDAILLDRQQLGPCSSHVKGTTSFGVFNFESGLPDSQAEHVFNSELVDDLEFLPWMQQTLYFQVKAVPLSRRKDFLTRIRRNWGYSKDLEASVALGGPAWLIEARARAMHVPRNRPNNKSRLCVEPVVPFVLNAEIQEESVNNEDAMEFMNRPKEDTGSCTIDNSRQENTKHSSWEDMQRQSEFTEKTSATQIDSDNRNKYDNSRNEERVQINDEDDYMSGGETEYESESLVKVRDYRKNMQRRGDSDVFFSVRNLGATTLLDDESEDENDVDSEEKELIDSNGKISGRGIKTSPIVVSDPSSNQKGFLRLVDTIARNEVNPEEEITEGNLSSSDRGDVSQSRRISSLHPNPNKMSVPITQPHSRSALQSTEMSETSDVTSRIDRLEAVMEQLVLLNATQLQQKQASMESQSNTSNVNEISNRLKNELMEIREKIENRAKEDEALRTEISMLRDQLTEHRQRHNVPETKSKDKFSVKERSISSSRVRKFPVPEIRLKTMLPRRLSNENREAVQALSKNFSRNKRNNG